MSSISSYRERPERERKIHINLFLRNTGHHEAAWRHPQAQPERTLEVGFYRELAQTAERGLFDSLFISDNYSGTWRRVEPFTLLSALAMATRHIGLIATVNTTYNEPFHIARQFASLDHISGGRAGWNIVTGAGGNDAYNFGKANHPDHALRYETAEEFVEVVKQLWDSWEDDALLLDKQSGRQFDAGKVHEIHFKGKFHAVRGPLNIPRPPQGYPVLVQAGSSDSGKELAAKTAEVIFTAQPSIEEAQSFYADVKSRLARYGRTPDQLQVLPGLSPIIAGTEAEAKELEDELFALTDVSGAIQRLSDRLGVDFTGYSLDSRVPVDGARGIETINGMKGRHQLLLDLIQRERPTFRELIVHLAGARGHLTFTGTPLQLADVIERWFIERVADGFNLMPPVFPGGLDIFVDKVVPELQNRGLFRTAYEAETLRGHLGLARPEHVRGTNWTAAGAEPSF
ncbi:LLM class flavin-dependent oxidoreductase [Paenibacillus piri]|uniref:LLM class flavin-dependent oxidoreductase n=1 Tax=Paenibacillus piri TaxID=2547395 RepID=A0A4R5KXP0_9BACL|nr:LLM class flavin-dependent oxidoreductase [Paenibacillus piri]TDG00840.1 LLM class flavin-dependent oxidoreductase [Paenibacillus piri]